MGPPVVAVAGPVLAMLKSTDLAAGLIVEGAEIGRASGRGWGSVPAVVGGLVMMPAVAGAVALIVIVAVGAEESEPTAQVTVPEALVQVPWVEVADVKPTPEGRVSVTVAPVAASGPLFFAVRV